MAIMAVGSLPVVLLVPAACAIVVAAALLSDRLVFRPLRTASAPTLMVASFSVGYIIQNTILVTYGARPKTIDLWSSLGEQLHFGAVRVPRLEVVTIAVTLVLLATLTAFSSAPATACKSAQRRKIFSWRAISASGPTWRSAWHSHCRAFSRQ